MSFSATALSTRRTQPVDPIYVADVSTLRGITTGSMLAFITGYFSEGEATAPVGWYIRDDNDTTTADDGYNTIVATNGKRWKLMLSILDTLQFTQDGTDAVTRPAEGKMQEVFSVFDFLTEEEKLVVEARSSALNVSVNVQKAFDAAFVKGAKLLINAGTYLVNNIYIYEGMLVEFDANAIFRQAAAGFCIRTSTAPGAPIPTDNVIRSRLINPRIDMNNKEGSAILWECAVSGRIQNPRITQVGVGTYNYDDGNGVGAYPTSGIAIKGIAGVFGAYWNVVDHPRISGGGNRHIWVGTSWGRPLVAGTYSKANMNRVNNALLTDANVAIDVYAGDDNVFDQCDVTGSTTGARIGVTGGGTYFCNRTMLPSLYAENNTTGIEVTSEASGTRWRFASTGGTATPYTNAGNDTGYEDPKRLGLDEAARFFGGEIHGLAGLKFLATEIANNDPNTINDFERGDWTPDVIGSTTPGTVNYVNRSGKFMKIANWCAAICRVNYNAGTGVGNLQILGLPFAALNLYSTPGLIRASNLTFPAGELSVSVAPSSSVLTVEILATGAAATPVAYDVAADLIILIIYPVT